MRSVPSRFHRWWPDSFTTEKASTQMSWIIQVSDSHSIQFERKRMVCYHLQGKCVKLRDQQGGDGIPLFFLLRTRGLWKHTLCAAASRPKDLLTSCCRQTTVPFTGRETGMFSWDGWGSLLKHMRKSRVHLFHYLWSFTWENHPLSVGSRGNLGTSNTANHPPHRWESQHEVQIQAMCLQQMFLSVHCVHSYSTHTYTYTLTLTPHTHS